MLKLLKSVVVAVGMSCLLPVAAQSAEVSLINGFYQSSKVTDGLETTNIALGGRFSDYLSAKLAWYGDFTIALKSYSAPSNEPGSMNDILLGGGARQFFTRMSEEITPYASAGVFYKTETSAPTWSAAATSWTEEKGIYYRGDLGLRLGFSRDLFVEVETSLFENPLTGKSSRITKTPTGETKVATDSVDIYIDTRGAFNNVTVSLGMKI